MNNLKTSSKDKEDVKIDFKARFFVKIYFKQRNQAPYYSRWVNESIETVSFEEEFKRMADRVVNEYGGYTSAIIFKNNKQGTGRESKLPENEKIIQIDQKKRSIENPNLEPLLKRLIQDFIYSPLMQK